MKKLNRRAVAGTVVLLVGLGITVAFAAWTTNGTGSGYTRADEADALTTVDVSATTTAQLFPGGTGDLKLRISNPNPYPVRVTDVDGNGTITSDKGPSCNGASTGVSFADQSSLSLIIPANDAATFTLTGSVSMSNASDTSCQNVVFTVPVALTGASNAA